MNQREMTILIPATRYRDYKATLTFIREVLGLEEHAVCLREDGKIKQAQVKCGSGIMMFGPGRPDNAFERYMADPQEFGGRETTTIYAVLPDRETLVADYQRAVDAGATVLMPLEARSCRGATFTLSDPEEHIWSFGDYDPKAD